MSDQKIPLSLSKFDSQGYSIDQIRAELGIGAIEDIVDHAIQLIIMRRTDMPDSEIQQVMDELDEALQVGGLLDGEMAPGPGLLTPKS